jgi:hypothetical protein
VDGRPWLAVVEDEMQVAPIDEEPERVAAMKTASFRDSA